MTKFPKEYNYKNIKPLLQTIDSNHNLYSSLFASDQKMHPGCVFSVFFQDLVYYFYKNQNKEINLNIGFGLSSEFHSKLNKSDLNKKQLQLQILKQIKQNKKFFQKLGFCNNINKESFVFSEEFNIYLRNVFVKLYQNGKIFTQKEVVYRSKIFQTNLFKNKIKKTKTEVTEYNLRYFIESKGNNIIIPTTKIETIFADVAVIVNPQDKRYKKLIGQNVIIPIINKSIPIIGDESVDSFKGTGVFRVTPGHDKFGLEMAKKHQLPINIFAIDTDGNFTEHAGEFVGKSAQDFFDNIIKYLDDIGNLESKKSIIQDNFFDLYTGEELDTITLDQRNIAYDYSLDYLLEEFNSKNILSIIPEHNDDIKNILENKKAINISNKSIKGILLPIIYDNKGNDYVINDDIILQQYSKLRSRKDLTFTLILSNLILDNQISNSFSLEEIIDVLFFSDMSGNKTKIEEYIQIYEKQSKDNSIYKRGLKDLKRFLGKIEYDTEKIKLMLEVLANSFAIKNNGDRFYLDFNEIFGIDDGLYIQNNDSFNKSFIDSVRILYKNKLKYSDGPYTEVKNLGGLFLSSIDKKDFSLNVLLLALEYSRTIIFSSLFFHPNLVDIKGKKILHSNSKFLTKDFILNFDFYGPDVMRLLILLGDRDGENVIFDTYKASEWNRILQKIRNANRYISKSYLNNIHKIKIYDIIKKIEEDVTDYDIWILHGIKSLLDDITYQLSENKVLEIGKKIVNFYTDVFCDKYLQCTKFYNQENTKNVVIFSSIIMLKLIKPYSPSFAHELMSKFNIENQDYNVFDLNTFILKEKNYKINIFMDMVDKLDNLKNKLGLKKHEQIDIFIQANQEFVVFFGENEHLFRNLINVGNIDCLKIHDHLPLGYEVDNVININLGAKAVIKQIEPTKGVILEITQERDNKLDQLQHLKSLIASISNTCNPDIIIRKKQDIEKLKDEIDDLNLQINKLKVK